MTTPHQFTEADDIDDSAIRDRIYVGLTLMMRIVLALFVADIIQFRGTYPLLHIVQWTVVVVAAAARQALFLPCMQEGWRLKALAVGACSTACLSTALGGILSDAYASTPLLLTGLTLATATLVGWGRAAQAVLSGAAACALALNLYFVGGLHALSYSEHVVFATLLAAGVVLAGSIEQQLKQQRRAEAQRRRSETRFQLLAEATHLVPWEVDLQTLRFTYVGPQAQALLGYPVENWYREDFWQEHIHPEDRESAIRTCLEKSKSETTYSLEYRMLGSSGEVVWVLNAVSVEPTAGTSGRLQGFLFDISRRRRHEQHRDALLAVARDLGELREVEGMRESASRNTAMAMPCDAAAVFAWDEAESAFRVLGQFGIPSQLLPVALQLRFGNSEPFGGRVSRGDTVVVNRLEEHPNLPIDYLSSAGVRRLLVAPLQVAGRDEGRLVAVRLDGPPFDEDDATLVQGIARQLAVALERSRLLEAQQLEARVSSGLAAIGSRLMAVSGSSAVYSELCRAVAETLGVEAVYLWLRTSPQHSGEDIYEAVAYYGGSSERWEAVHAVRATQLDDYMARLRHERVIVGHGERLAEMPQGAWAASLGVAQMVHIGIARADDVFGVLSLNYNRVVAWNTFEQRLSDGIARLAALAIENAQLFDRLEQANRVKSDFVATMSHELRTPLNVIIGYSELLLDEAFGPLTTEQIGTVRRMLTNSCSLLELINQTLDMGRLESKSLAIELSERDPAEFLAELNRETGEMQQRPGLLVQWKLPMSMPRLRTDFVKLKVALRNLLHNAVKFTPSGEITVTARALADGIEFQVADTGVGIPAEAQAIIFEAFRQVDASLTRRFEGVGLGLYITQQLLSLIGGRISLQSTLGKGSTFTVFVPFEAAVAASPMHPPLLH